MAQQSIVGDAQGKWFTMLEMSGSLQPYQISKTPQTHTFTPHEASRSPDLIVGSDWNNRHALHS